MTSTYEDILVLCGEDGQWPRTLAYANFLATPGRARLTALTPYENLPVHGGLNLRDDVAHCRAAMPEAIGTHAAWADAVVMDAATAAAHLECIVVESAKPCIVLPDDAALRAPGCIALGWNGSIESMRAIKASLPLLRAAESVLLLDAGLHPHEHCSAPPSAAAFLAEHGVLVSHLHSAGDAAAAGRRVIELAIAHGADLLVMGAWRHRRFSDWDAGTAVMQALRYGTIPLLLAH